MRVVAGIRPESVLIAGQPKPNGLEGEVRTVLASGPETVLRVRSGGQTFSLLASQETGLASGDRINMVLPPDSILVFDQESGRLLTDAP
jgi:ABC-type sugar transport system ATPase subunit